MKQPFLVGNKLYLRPLQESDLTEKYLNWINDHEVTRYMESGTFPATLDSLRQYYDHHKDSNSSMLLAIVDRESDEHIGNITLSLINWVHQTCEIGIMLGDKAFWGRGYMLEAENLLLDYAFNRLNLQKVTAGAIIKNSGVIITMKKLGFQTEGKLRRQIFVDGGFVDVVRMGLLREEFQKTS